VGRSIGELRRWIEPRLRRRPVARRFTPRDPAELSDVELRSLGGWRALGARQRGFAIGGAALALVFLVAILRGPSQPKSPPAPIVERLAEPAAAAAPAPAPTPARAPAPAPAPARSPKMKSNVELLREGKTLRR
jgi:hypothetical protein